MSPYITAVSVLRSSKTSLRLRIIWSIFDVCFVNYTNTKTRFNNDTAYQPFSKRVLKGGSKGLCNRKEILKL